MPQTTAGVCKGELCSTYQWLEDHERNQSHEQHAREEEQRQAAHVAQGLAAPHQYSAGEARRCYQRIDSVKREAAFDL